MKKIFWNENNKLHKEIYILLISVTLFVGSIMISENFISADETQKYEKPSGEHKGKRPGMFGEKPTEEQIREKLNSAVEAGSLTQEEADAKLESILSGEHKGKRPGMFGKKPTEEQIREKLNSAVEAGSLTQEEADAKLESILSGEHKGKRPGKNNQKQIIL